MFESPIKAWLNLCHGEGASNQFQFYRCRFCQRIVNHNSISQGGCFCGNNELVPAILSRWDMFKLIFFPWTFNEQLAGEE